MKITDVKTYVVDMYRANFVFLEIETDEGITGVGEATLEYREQAVVQAIQDWREFLIGKDPLDTELIQMHLERDTYWRYGPVLSSALSGIDIALWDIKGKYYGAPVYQLLGGKVREGLPIYVNAWFAGAKTTPEFVEKAKETVAKGFRALKWDPFGSAYLNLTKQELVDSIDRVAAIREAVGADFPVLVKVNTNCAGEADAAYAEDIVYYCKQFEALGADAIELSGYNWLGLGKKKVPTFYLERASKIAKEVKIPTILVGGIRNMEQVDQILAAGIEFVSASRPFICQPDFYNVLEKGEESKCIGCTKCLGNIWTKEGRRCVTHEIPEGFPKE